jgi:hypothetical protein
MRKHILVVCLLIFSLRISAQQTDKKVSSVAFENAANRLLTQEAQWQKVVNAVDIEQLHVDYPVGKRFQETKSLVNQELEMSASWAKKAVREHTYFSDVNFLSSVQDLQAQMQLFVALLLQFQLNSQADESRVEKWTEAMSAIANGPINEIWKTTYSYTTHRALLIDGQPCISKLQSGAY